MVLVTIRCFIPTGKKITFGEMNKKEKILMDHRYIAFKKLKKKIKDVQLFPEVL